MRYQDTDLSPREVNATRIVVGANGIFRERNNPMFSISTKVDPSELGLSEHYHYCQLRCGKLNRVVPRMKTAPHTTETAVDEETAAETIRHQIDPHIVTRRRVVIIGLGGIGLFLAAVVTFLAGLRLALEPGDEITVFLVDGKMLSERHTYRLDVPEFTNKAVAVAGELLQRHECEGLDIRYFPELVTQENVGTVIQEGDCVLVGVDNHATRNVVSRHCAGGELRNVVLISAGNDGVEDGRQLPPLPAPVDEISNRIILVGSAEPSRVARP